MKITFNFLLNSRYLHIALLVIVVSFLLIRFEHIDADFPSHITSSGVLYTDEGWYAGSAIRDYLTGNWHLPGDINTAVTQPGGQILYRVAFAIFGLSLSTVRGTEIVCFLLFVLFMAFWVRKYHGNLSAILTALILSTNFYAFAYSRLALRFLIALCFTIASFWVSEQVNGRHNIIKLVMAALLLTYGILTYTSAIFAVPLLLLIAWKNGNYVRERLRYTVLIGAIILTLAGGYFLTVKQLYPVDVANDTRRVSMSLVTSFAEWSRNLAVIIVSLVKNLGPDFAGMTLLLVVAAALVSRSFRSNALVVILLGYILVNLVMLSVNTYTPPRYYLFFLAPFAGLAGIGCITLFSWLAEQRLNKLAVLPVLLVLVVVFHGAWNITTYLSNPQYSFYQMAQGVKNIIQQRQGTTTGVILFGDIADSVSLEAGTIAVNNGVWTVTHEAARLQQYHPSFLIVHTSDLVKLATEQGATVTELGRWDVYNNYYGNGEQVRLYYATWP